MDVTLSDWQKKELEKLEKNVKKNFILLNEERELNLYDRE